MTGTWITLTATGTTTSVQATPPVIERRRRGFAVSACVGRSAGLMTPPVGTIVYGHERVIYLGDGEWQPLGHKANYQSSPPVEALDNHGA